MLPGLLQRNPVVVGVPHEEKRIRRKSVARRDPISDVEKARGNSSESGAVGEATIGLRNLMEKRNSRGNSEGVDDLEKRVKNMRVT